MAAENRPNTLWPVGTKVTYLNAYGLEPVDGAVIKHYGETNVLVEDARCHMADCNHASLPQTNRRSRRPARVRKIA